YLDGNVGGPIAPAELLRQMSFHSVAVELAARSGAAGPALTISTGCTAGLDAVATAFDLIRSGVADAAIAGSAEAPLTPVVMAAFDLIGATTRRNHDPGRASRPFDRDRDGFVLAEGAALILLEEHARAVKRGARIYAEIRGTASVSNAFHMTNLPAAGEALARCIREALVDAQIDAEHVDHVSAHGSSTQQNDLCETNAIKAALGETAARVTVNALKSMVGHALGASNALEVACCALELRHQFVCPTANLEEPGPGCDLDYVRGSGRARRLRHVVKLSNGFSGIHTAMVLSEAPCTAAS
ncbi:MAG: beta-ketoacyl-[acyl-carrier-protein] synthase family protein, partial [Vicinamibacterales bacterium]